MELNKNLHKELVQATKDLLPRVRCIYLFGSFATGEHNSQSDIDIAVLCEQKIEAITRWNIQSQLAKQLDRDVDLVDLLSASTVMQFQVVNSGVCLFDTGAESTKFEMQVISMYQHLNVERADILSQFMGGGANG